MNWVDIFRGARALDAAIVLVYLAVSFTFGVAASRFYRTRDDPGEEGYYLAGRRVPGWLNGISIAATAINADVAPLYCGLAVVIGLPMAWFYLSRFAFAWFLLAAVFAIRWHQMRISTAPEFYQLRFGGQAARFVRGYTSLYSVAVNMVPWIGAGLLGVHKILGPIFGIDSKMVTLSLVLPLLVTYVWIAGFAGVIVTDFVQSLVILLASGVLLVRVLMVHGGPSALGEAIQSVHPAEHTEILGAFPVWGHEVMGPLVVLFWFIVPTIGQGGSLDLMGQRIFSCRSARDAARVPVWAIWSLCLMLLLLTLPTLGALVRHPELYHATGSAREQAYGLLLREYLPSGLLGIALAALLASVMSTVDSHLNYGAQTLVNDFLRSIWPQARWLARDSVSAIWIGRLIMLLMLASSLGVMIFADSLFSIAVLLAGLFGTTASLYWGQWWWWRVNFWSWLVAMVGGPLVYAALSATLPRWESWNRLLSASEAMRDTMAMLQALIAMGMTTLLWMGVTLLTPPQPMTVLKAFYLRARPMGLWGPVRQAVLADDPRAPVPAPGVLPHGVLTACWGTVSITAGMLGLSQLFIGKWWFAIGMASMCLLFTALFRVAQGHQWRRMEADG